MAKDRWFDRTELIEDEAIASSVFETPVARWFRDLTHAVTQWGCDLLRKHERFLLAYVEIGYLTKAAKQTGITRFEGAAVLAKFCDDYGLMAPPDFHGSSYSRAKGWETRKDKA